MYDILIWPVDDSTVRFELTPYGSDEVLQTVVGAYIYDVAACAQMFGIAANSIVYMYDLSSDEDV